MSSAAQGRNGGGCSRLIGELRKGGTDPTAVTAASAAAAASHPVPVAAVPAVPPTHALCSALQERKGRSVKEKAAEGGRGGGERHTHTLCHVAAPRSPGCLPRARARLSQSVAQPAACERRKPSPLPPKRTSSRQLGASPGVRFSTLLRAKVSYENENLRDNVCRSFGKRLG